MIEKRLAILAVLSVLLLIVPSQAQLNGAVLYSFTSSPDGANPLSRLTSDGAGDFYGTTALGGLGFGTVFELSPNGNGGWNEIVLYSFTGGVDGAYPNRSDVIFDKAGNLYGTTSAGGRNQYGVVFELSPVGSNWTETVLYSFCAEGYPCSTTGAQPLNGVIFDLAGNLYGTTLKGGNGGVGTVFELSPSGGTWTERVIYQVGAPYAGGLTIDASGNLFGVGVSTVFELSPNGTRWNPTVIYTVPLTLSAKGTLVFDQAGNLYGTAYHGGNRSYDSVYRLSPQVGKKLWKKTTIFNVKIYDTSEEAGGVVLDTYGDIFGTTFSVGGFGKGTVFELVPPVGIGNYTHQVLWNFDGTDGSGPGNLILDGGVLYGATDFGGIGYQGGNSGYGVVFKVTPP
jgi:uncharacterized repeat protein (TIGR03803 family)